MSTYLGNKLLSGVATNTISNAHSLLDYKWADHILNEMSWLRSDTFSWQSGNVYTGVYNHLLADINGKSSSTETIGSYTITYYLANDGHKIVLPNMATTIQNIYNSTGSAWYYILDTDNKRFKLPRCSHGDVVEKYKNGTEWYRVYSDGWCEQGGHSSSSGGQTIQLHKEMADVNYDVVSSGTIFYNNTAKTTTSFTCSGAAWGTANVAYLDWCVFGYAASYPANSQYKYLYFYAGNFSQSAAEQTAGITTEQLNDKLDADAGNATSTGKQTIVGWGIPDYDSAVSLSAPTTSYQDYTATKPCMIELLCFYMAGALTYKINNHEYNIGGNTTSQQQGGCLMHIYLDTGDILSYKTQYTNQGTIVVNRATMFPLKGA